MNPSPFPSVIPPDHPADIKLADPVDVAPEPAPARPNGLRLVVAANSAALAPWKWMAAADLTALTAHYLTPSLAVAALTAAGASTAAGGWALWRTRETRLRKTIKTLRNRRAHRTNIKTAAAAGALWTMTGTVWTPIGPDGIMQLTLLGGGLALAAPYLYRNRRRDLPAAEPVAELPAPRDDSRLAKFRDQFCTQSTPLDGARLHDLEDVPGGFRFHVELMVARRGTYRDVKVLEDQIAALYDVPLDNVSVEPPESRSARRAVVTVLTETRAHEREDLWDGNSTYDPATGCFGLGRYADSSPSRWQLHAPRSGAASGLSVGVIGSGKTGTLHVVAAEAGQAKLCRTCLTEQSCSSCTLERICALWVADPQAQGLSVWRGRADITAYGPLASLRLLWWTYNSMRERSAYFGRMEWTDHLGRRNVGKGWFDPTPAHPMLLGVIDEWPVLSRDPEIAQFAVPMAAQILEQGRKVGVGLVFGSQDGDVDILGDRSIREQLGAFNACVHRSDQVAKRMLGIEGNPADLAMGVPGLSYLRGIDRRSDIPQRTKTIREFLQPGENGVDVREIAERIARDPITYDDAVLNKLTELGYTGPGHVLSDDDGWTLADLTDDRAETEPDVVETPVNTPSAPANPAAVNATQQALTAHGTADIYDLMQQTQLSALDVSRAVDTLIAAGAAVQGADGRYSTCP